MFSQITKSRCNHSWADRRQEESSELGHPSDRHENVDGQGNLGEKDYLEVSWGHIRLTQ